MSEVLKGGLLSCQSLDPVCCALVMYVLDIAVFSTVRQTARRW